MKRVLLLSLILITFNKFFSQVVFQNDLENWSNPNTPAGMKGSKTNLENDSIIQYSTSVHGGQYAVQLINTESTHKRFTTQPLQVTTGTTYNISFWVRGKGNIRTGLFDGRTANSGYAPYNPYITINSSTWTQYTQSVTCENTNNAGEFIFSVQNTSTDIDHLQLDDIEITINNPNAPSISITLPVNNSQVMYSFVNIEFTVSNFVLGTDGKVKYTVNSSAPSYTLSSPITLTSLSDGQYSVILELVDTSQQSLNPPVSANVNFTVNTALPPYVSIYDIQFTANSSGDSPYADDIIQTSGIVTGTHSQGFFLQNGYGEWNGIYVFSAVYAPQVVIGDSITIVGKVKEYYNLTEITNISYLQVHSQNNILPNPINVTASQVKSEQYEGVLVKILNATCVNPNAGYGMWTVNDGTDTCKIHNLLYNYTPVLNRVYNITGPVYYSFGEFRIEPRFSADIVDITNIDEKSVININFFPNPVNNNLNIIADKNISSIMLFDLSGKIICTYYVSETNTTTIDVSSLYKGSYVLKIHFFDNEGKTVNFIKH